MDNSAIDKIAPLSSRDLFYAEYHQEIFQAIQSIVEQGRPVDTVTLADELRRSGKLEAAGGESYLVELTTKVVSDANVEYHARILKEKEVLRRMIVLGQKMVNAGYEPTSDPFDVLSNTQTALDDIGIFLNKKKAVKLGTLLPEILEVIEDIRTGERKTFGIPSGFLELDRLTGGFEPLYYVIAGRPSMGKTSLGLSVALNMTRGVPMALFSLEMSDQAIALRAISKTARLDNYLLRNGKYEEVRVADITAACTELGDRKLWIVDQPGMTLLEIRSHTKRLIKEQGIKGIILDYLQLMNAPGHATREREISYISQGLKNMCKELGIFVIALSQLSRETEKRKDKKPELPASNKMLTLCCSYGGQSITG